MKLLSYRFPLLIQLRVINLMNGHDVFAISTVSKRSREMVKQLLNNQEFKIHFFIDNSIYVSKKCLDHYDERNLNVRFDYDPSMETQLKLWNFFDRESIEVQVEEKANSGKIVSYWPKELQFELVKYFVEFFPKNNCELSIRETDVAVYREKMESVRAMGEIFRYETFNLDIEDEEEPRDELVHTVLMESGVNLDMTIMCPVSDDFQLDFENTPQLKFKSLCFNPAEWISKDQLITMLGSCDQIQLFHVEYSAEELSEIYKTWMAGSRVDYLLIGKDNFYNNETTDTMLGELPGAIAIREAEIKDVNSKEFKTSEFDRGECVMITQTDGNNALIFSWSLEIILTTHFKMETIVIYE